MRNIRHHLMTTQQFVASEAYRQLKPVDLLFVDGYHSAEQACFDHEAFQEHLSAIALVLFHDSTAISVSKVYGQEKRYDCRVKDYIDVLKKNAAWQVFDLPFGDGVTLVRRAT